MDGTEPLQTPKTNPSHFLCTQTSIQSLSLYVSSNKTRRETITTGMDGYGQTCVNHGQVHGHCVPMFFSTVFHSSAVLCQRCR